MADDDSTSRPTKQPQFFVRPANKEAAKDMAKTIADGLIVQINASRVAKGLPPLTKD